MQRDLFSALGQLPLKFLKLKVYTDNLDPTWRASNVAKRMLCTLEGLPEPPEPAPVPFTPAELSLNALDMDAVVGHMTECLTTLETAHVLVLRSPGRGGERFEKTITKGRRE